MNKPHNARPLGLRISTEFERVDARLAAAALELPASVIGDACNRQQGLVAGFSGYGGRRRFAGPALTVRVRPGDNLVLHKALDLAQPGDVVVCDAGAGMNAAILGAMMGAYAVKRGIAGIVIDGAIRDVEELAAMDIAIVARGATPNGPFKSGPGEIGEPIACGGVSVSSGDLVVGDADGVVVVPRALAGSILDQAAQRERAEAAGMAEIEAGTWPRGWVDEAIAKL